MMIGFVILHYITSEYTIKTIDSILENAKGGKVIVVVDNASPNNSLDDIKKHYTNNKEIKYLKLPKNVGFANGNNAGYQFIREHYTAEFITVLNNDVLLTQNNFYSLLEESYEKNHFGILGPDVFSMRDGRHQNPEALNNFTLADLEAKRKKIKLKLRLKFLIFLKWKLKKVKKVNYKAYEPTFDKRKVTQDDVILHGSIYVFSKDFILNEDECFYGKTFMYMESYILYYLAKKKNYNVIYDPSIEVIHYEDVSTDISVKSKYKKAVFTLRCLLASTNSFIELMRQDELD